MYWVSAHAPRLRLSGVRDTRAEHKHAWFQGELPAAAGGAAEGLDHRGSQELGHRGQIFFQMDKKKTREMVANEATRRTKTSPTNRPQEVACPCGFRGRDGDGAPTTSRPTSKSARFSKPNGKTLI